MKRLLCLILAALLLAACAQTQAPFSSGSGEVGEPSQSEPQAPDQQPSGFAPETRDLRAVIGLPAEEHIDDPEFLSEIWNGYVFDTFINIANGFAEFSQVEEIPRIELIRYLNIKMQRQGEEGVWTPGAQKGDTMGYSVPLERLEEYCARYFGRSVDFTGGRDQGGDYFYDEGEGLVYFYPASTADSFDVPPYDSIEEWPNWRLNYVDRVEGGLYIANVSRTHVASLDEMNELYTSHFILKKREDGSFYFVGLVGVWPDTHRVELEGSYRELTLPEEFENGIFLCEGDQPDTAVFWRNATDSSLELMLGNLLTGEVLSRRMIEYPGEYSIAFLEKRGGRIIAATGRQMGVFGLDLSEIRPMADYPADLRNALGGSARLRSFDFLADLSLMSFSDGEGIKIYNLKTGELTLVPGTEPYEPEGRDVEWTGYGDAMFVLGGKKLFATQLGYEWCNGYLLYDLESGETIAYPYGGGYSIGRLVTDTGALLMNHSDRSDNDRKATWRIDFKTGLAEEIPETFEGEMGFYHSGDSRYSARMNTRIAGDRMERATILRVDVETGEEVPLDLVVTAPNGSTRMLGTTEGGSVYVSVSYLGERYLLEASTPRA